MVLVPPHRIETRAPHDVFDAEATGGGSALLGDVVSDGLPAFQDGVGDRVVHAEPLNVSQISK